MAPLVSDLFHWKHAFRFLKKDQTEFEIEIWNKSIIQQLRFKDCRQFYSNQSNWKWNWTVERHILLVSSLFASKFIKK